MIELSKVLGTIPKTDWKAERTIVLCSYDAKGYDLSGSTEFVEEYIPLPSHTAVPFLNMDIGAVGLNLGLPTTPDWHHIVIDTIQKVLDDYH